MATRKLLSKEITLSQAQKSERNVLYELGLPEQEAAFLERLTQKRRQLEASVAFHLGINPTNCFMLDPSRWFHGSYNICIPVFTTWPNPTAPGVIVRCPLPYKSGEAFRPGNMEEKLRCEAGAYAWLRQNCPSIPIPQLYGFGLASGQRYTALHHLPWYSQYPRRVCNYILSWFGYAPSLYIRQVKNDEDIDYMVIEDVYSPHSKMLSQLWKTQRHDTRLQKNLYRSLSQIMLALTRVQLPCIGAFRLDDRGSLQLDNRPITFDITTLESEGIPLDIPRSRTYSRVDTYIFDILSTYDCQLLHQPNSMKNRDDGESQALGLAMARLSFPHLLRRHGPFFFSLTDLHQSNFFVDEDWNIVKVIDLEFSSSLPLEFHHPPFWLSDRDVGSIDNEEYRKCYDTFVSVLEEEESSQGREKILSSTMRESWKNGVFWASLALTSPTGFQNLLYDSVLPRLNLSAPIYEGTFTAMAALWQVNSGKTIETKLDDFNSYQEELQKVFITASD